MSPVDPRPTYPFYLAGRPAGGTASIAVTDEYSGEVISRVAEADAGDVDRAIGAAAGGVVISDAPAWRVEQMPYGGVKASGLGRGGGRFAIEEMTEIRLFAVRDPGT